MADRIGRFAVTFAIGYLRRRYRREIRIGIGVGALALGIGAYLATRNVREG
jgi:hypothetical protein